MNKIEIQTTQNVTIEFELASVFQRVLAFLLDQAFLILFIIFIIFAATIFEVLDPMLENSNVLFTGALMFIYFFYTLFFETLLNGRTPGKIILGIRVRRIDGSAPEIMDFIIRWIFRIPDIAASAGTLAFFLVGSSKNKQRLGDLLANTIVVNEMKNTNVNLERILKIKEADAVEIQYPEVVQLSEEAIITIKDLVLRQKQYPSAHYSQLINEAARKIEKELGIQSIHRSKSEFLKKIVREFVILTR